MKCPRCKATVTGAPDATGLILCLGCGARLRSRPAATAAVPRPAAAETDGPVAAPAEAPPAAKPRAREPRSVAKAGAETLPPVPARVEAPSELETVLGEIRALSAVQDEILSLLKERSAETDGAAAAMGPDDTVPPPASAVRSRRRKAVLLIDDDEQSRAAAVQALEQAEVPVRTAPDRRAEPSSCARWASASASSSRARTSGSSRGRTPPPPPKGWPGSRRHGWRAPSRRRSSPQTRSSSARDASSASRPHPRRREGCWACSPDARTRSSPACAWWRTGGQCRASSARR